MPEKIYFTVLPCGTTASGALNFTAVLTPALESSADVPDLFQNWPGNSENLPKNDWTIQIKQNGATVATGTGKPISALPDKDLWIAFLKGSNQKDGRVEVRKRKGAEELKAAWVQSHDANYLHSRHSRHRTFHLVRQLVHSIDPDDDSGTHDEIDENIDATAPRNIYIHPVIQSSGGDISMTSIVADRNMALAFGQAHFGTDSPLVSEVNKRIKRGRQRLEEEEGERLTGVALMALFRISAESVHRQDPAAVDALVHAVDLAVANLNTKDATLFEEVQRYVAFHLFKRRSTTKTPDCPAPDFHQLLGLLHQYPALLRPLGLAFDFTSVVLNAVPPPGPVTVSVVPPAVSGVTPAPLETNCVSAREFVAASRRSANPEHVGRFLNLQLKGADGSPLFQIVIEDADGSSHKLTQQASAAARSSEYQPSRKPPDDGLGLPDPKTHLPSSRTSGVALYQSHRANSLAETLANTPSSGAASISPLFIEDLTLGYRVDVKNVTSQSAWMSLHERQSSYEVGDHRWRPDGISVAADEGFMTLAATQWPAGSPRDGNQAVQLQVHQSLVLWTGWSLSVPLPRSSGEESPAKPRCTILAVKPTYTLKSGGTLPKLRFDQVYALRLRHVDLAGNSLPVDAPHNDNVVLTMESPFSRHEPIRAPQILLETPIDRLRHPGDHSDRIVIRDDGAHDSRLLVPPREALRMVELHGFAESTDLPDSAFPEFQLMPDGTFPSLRDAVQAGWIRGELDEKQKKSVESQDGLLLPRVAGRRAKPYYPDPMARFVRIEPLVLQQDLSTYTPWRQDEDVVNSNVKGEDSFYVDFNWLDKWPLASPIRILTRAADPGKPLRIRQGWMPLKEPGRLPNVPVLHVELPEGWTVALRLTSSACVQPHPHETRLNLMANLMAEAPASRNPVPAALPQGAKVNLFYSFDRIVNTRAAAPLAMAVPAGGTGPAGRYVLASLPRRPLVSSRQESFGDRLRNALSQVSPDTFVCGTTHYVTPPRILTLVHAVQKPLQPPDFDGDEHGSGFVVMRAAGEAPATVLTKFTAHWLSTAKIACRALWSDKIDDLSKPDQVVRQSDEIAFEFVNSGKNEPSGKLKAGTRGVTAVHRFRDTRAHKVTYTLSAFSRFRECYREDVGSSSFVKAGERKCTVDVLSSVRPPVPSVAYVLPAFAWQDAWDAGSKSWKRGRTMVFRVYLNRPFLVSGDEECLGVVLGRADSGSSPVTEWGKDPTVKSDSTFSSNLMTASDFSGSTPIPGCMTFEGGKVDILPFPVEYCKKRELWFCDIPLSPSRTASAFARLALVRWQPKAIHLGDTDARLSQAALADFLQVGPDRWVSVRKVNAKRCSVTVSGVFRTATVDSNAHQEQKEHTISCSIEQRWHRLGSDMGWRPVCPGPLFAYQGPAAGSNISSWSAVVDLPHSSSVLKFRLLLEEHEWLLSDDSKANTGPTTQSNKRRTTYLHYIEL